MMRGPAAGAALAILGATLLGVVLLLWGGVYLWGETTPGTVVAVHWAGSGSDRACSPEVTYQVDGEPYRMMSMVAVSPCSWEEGERITIYFRPSNPADGYLFGIGHLMPMWFLTACGLALLGLSVRAFAGSRGEVDAGAERPRGPILALSEAPLGDVVGVRGKAQATGSTLTAPMSGRTCLAYEVEVRQPVYGEEGELIHRASAAAPFILREASGAQAELLDGTAIDVALEPDRRGSTEEEPSERLTELLTEAGFDSVEARTTDNDYLWTEGIVEEGGEVVIHGCVRPEHDDQSGYRAGAPRFLVEAPPEGNVIVSSAQPSPTGRNKSE